MTPNSTFRTLLLVSLVLITSLINSAQAQKNADPKEQAMILLRKNIRYSGLDQVMLDESQVSHAYEDKTSGTFLVYLQQAYAHIPVYNKISIYVFRDDKLIRKKTDIIRKVSPGTYRNTSYAISPDIAVRLAAAHFSVPVNQGPQLLRKDELNTRFNYRVSGPGLDSLSSDLVWLPVPGEQTLRLAWNVRMATPDRQGDWFVRIDANTGAFIEQNSLIVYEDKHENCEDGSQIFDVAQFTSTANDQHTNTGLVNGDPIVFADQEQAPPPNEVTSASYRVYPVYVESPNFGSRVLETNPWLKAGPGSDAATLGWHYNNTTTFTTTRGNNVWAQEDMEGTDQTSGLTDNSTTAFPTLTFDRTLDPLANPSVGDNLRAGIDNLFYWSNIMHDVSYVYGFDEASGNFQAANLGRGGQGNDYVHAFAEHGAGLNNANFGTPPDGFSPTMRMYQWNGNTTATFHVNAPSAIAGDYLAVQNSINLNTQLAYTGAKTGNIILYTDFPGTHFGCQSPDVNAPSIAGSIVMMDRGGSGCNFVTKIKNAQNLGAIGVIVVNNVAGAPSVMGGIDITLHIPAIMISQADGNILKANLTGLNGTMATGPGVYRDGSIDNGIVAHEYTHGISTRLTGGPFSSGCLNNFEQGGEGWSDYVSMMLTTNWSTATPSDGANARSIGTYALSQPANGVGIRIYPYSTNMAINPWTYGMMAGSTGGEPHNIGEIWCATIWDMTWNIIQQEGIHPDIYHGTGGNNIALQLVMMGLKLQPCYPGFIDGRDAILAADSILYGYRHKCAIWNAFARRGMGKSARQGSSDSYTDQVAATDLPIGLGVEKKANKSTFVTGEQITYTINATCDCGTLNNITVVDTLPTNLEYISSTGGAYTAPVVTFSGLNFTAGETKTFTIRATALGAYAEPVTLINDSRDPANYTWTNTTTVGPVVWTETTSRSHTPTHSWFASDPGSPTDLSLNSGDLLLDSVSTLSFWHYYNMELTYDGGVLEITTDNGVTWKDLGPFMTQNGYNDILYQTNPSGQRPAFTGSTGGQFIQTIVNLSGFAGTTARIRFRSTSDESVGSDGWYIDDIVLKNARGVANNAFAYNGTTLLSTSRTLGLFIDGVLPVHFISFDARKQDKTSALHWKVSEEVNVADYVVERSADGEHFSPVGVVPYNNSGAVAQDYYFIDADPLPGVNYYRIAERDIDGRSMWSVVKLVRFDNAGLIVKLSPVPTYNHSVQLTIENAGPASFTASLVNTVGQVMKVYNVKNGVNTLDLQQFSAGVYYLKIESGNGNKELRKLIVR